MCVHCIVFSNILYTSQVKSLINVQCVGSGSQRRRISTITGWLTRLKNRINAHTAPSRSRRLETCGTTSMCTQLIGHSNASCARVASPNSRTCATTRTCTPVCTVLFSILHDTLFAILVMLNLYRTLLSCTVLNCQRACLDPQPPSKTFVRPIPYPILYSNNLKIL